MIQVCTEWPYSLKWNKDIPNNGKKHPKHEGLFQVKSQKFSTSLNHPCIMIPGICLRFYTGTRTFHESTCS